MRNKFVSLSKQKHLQILSTISSPSIAWWPASLHPPVLSPSQSGSHWDVEDDLWLLIFSPLCWWALCGSVIWQQCVVITDEEESNCLENQIAGKTKRSIHERLPREESNPLLLGIYQSDSHSSILLGRIYVNRMRNQTRIADVIGSKLWGTRIGFFNHICVRVARPGRPQSPQRNSKPYQSWAGWKDGPPSGFDHSRAQGDHRHLAEGGDGEERGRGEEDSSRWASSPRPPTSVSARWSNRYPRILDHRRKRFFLSVVFFQLFELWSGKKGSLHYLLIFLG